MAVLWAQVEVHKAYAEVHETYVEPHTAYVEVRRRYGTPCRGAQDARNPPELAQITWRRGPNTV